MKFLGAWCVAWAAGLAAYAAILQLVWSQTVPPANRQALLFWSTASWLLVAALFHGPAMRMLRRRAKPSSPWWAFPLVGAALSMALVTVLIPLFGGGLRALASPAASLYALFGTCGCVFGLAYVLLHPSR